MGLRGAIGCAVLLTSVLVACQSSNSGGSSPPAAQRVTLADAIPRGVVTAQDGWRAPYLLTMDMQGVPGAPEEPLATWLARSNPIYSRTACLRKEADHWALEGLDQPCSIADGSHEQLALNFSAQTVVVMANTAAENRPDRKYLGGGRMEHGDYPITADGKRIWLCHLNPALKEMFEQSHNICVSSFAANHVSGSSVVGSVFNAPFAAAGVRVYQVELDTDAILAAARESGAITQGSEATVSAVRAAIDGATTASTVSQLIKSGQLFLHAHPSLNDVAATKLAALRAQEVQQAQDRKVEIERQQQLTQQRQAQADIAVAAARKAEETERQREIARNRVAVLAFRKSVKVGADTHCGLVLDVNGPVAIVQAPADIGRYGLKINQLYPAGMAPCRFLNGVYQDPGLPF